MHPSSLQKMDLNNGQESGEEQEKMEPGELLEDFWFFSNLLHRKPRMPRSMSDPCTSSNLSSQQDNLCNWKSYEDASSMDQKLPGQGEGDQIRRPDMIAGSSPSEPGASSLESQGSGQYQARKDGDKSNRKMTSKGRRLLRVPSLPTNLQESQDFHDEEEVEFSMGKLIRQASMNNSDRSLPPRQHGHAANKVSAPNPSLSIMHRSRRKSDPECAKLEGLETTQRRMNKQKTPKSFTELEYQELQGFKDLGFDTSPDHVMMNVVPAGLQEKKRIQEGNETSTRRSAWKDQISSTPTPPPVPKWGRKGNGNGKRSSEDMKAQIKFWARAVASNVRQEC